MENAKSQNGQKPCFWSSAWLIDVTAALFWLGLCFFENFLFHEQEVRAPYGR